MSQDEEKAAELKVNDKLRRIISDELAKRGIVAALSAGRLRIDNLPMACRIEFQGRKVVAQFMKGMDRYSPNWEEITLVEETGDSLADPNFDPQVAIKRVIELFNHLNAIRAMCNIDISKLPLTMNELKKMVRDAAKPIQNNLKLDMSWYGEYLTVNFTNEKTTPWKRGNSTKIWGFKKDGETFLYEGYPEDIEKRITDLTSLLKTLVESVT